MNNIRYIFENIPQDKSYYFLCILNNLYTKFKFLNIDTKYMEKLLYYHNDGLYHMVFSMKIDLTKEDFYNRTTEVKCLYYDY